MTVTCSLVLPRPFPTRHTAHFELPLLGELHLPSAFFFDLGVFSVVVGATMLILTALAHQSLRSHRLPVAAIDAADATGQEDRKSTRLNSSHVRISYAVF